MTRDTLTGRRVPATLLVTLAFLGAAVAALGYWTSHGAGTASASVGTLNPPTNISASAPSGSSTVSVSWTASAAGGGAVAPQGYYVTRTSTTTNTTSAACGTSPTSLTTLTSCSDASVPADTYTYRVIA